MGEAADRPDPDALLRRVQEDEARAKRGKLKIFFGFAPGVGKTYRMLQVARDLIAEQKLDVIVGLVETHGRHETASLVGGLEVLPRRRVTHRGQVLDDFDLDAALARRPKLLLVDELAHTNAPGARHPKRWQDVEELLDAGIDVFTTMNVQHVESLNDVVAQITRVQVRETVPDFVIDRADGIELVDIAPEELLERLSEGKVYLPDQARRAAAHFFQKGNLLALRELALRRTAQRVDEDVLEYREQEGVAATWPAGERILVCVGPSPGSGRLIRAAARMAAGLRCPWIAAYVDASNARPPSEADRQRLEAHLRVAEQLGATVTRLAGVDVADAILYYARRHNVTRIVIGKPTHPRTWDRFFGSLVDEIVRGSGDIDVHVIRGDAGNDGAREAPAAPVARVPARRYAGAALLAAGALVVAFMLRGLLDLPDLEMIFLLAVMVAAVRFGRGPSMLAAGIGVACYDFFFVEPYYSFSVDDRRYILTFGMFFVLSFAISELTERLRRQEQDARDREERTATLYALTRDLASADALERIAVVVARHAAQNFAANAVVLGADSDDPLRVLGAWPAGARLSAKDEGVARWSYEHEAPAGRGTDTLPGADALCMPLLAGRSRLGVLALLPPGRAELRVDQRNFLDVLCRQAATALERVRLSEQAKRSAVRAETEEMRSSLLAAVSHDLRTPLASITGAATSLRDDPDSGAENRRELLDSIVDQAERLERLVSNLLDMTRLAAGATALRRDWVPLDEIVGSALLRLESRLAGRNIRVAIPAELPLLHVDPVLFEQVFVNLLENAAKYTPAGTPIDITASADGDPIEIVVADHGPGLPPGAESRVFDKFYRGPHAGVPGAGLGLPISKGIVEAHGGTVRAETRGAGGAAFRISLPRTAVPPTIPPEALS